VPAVAIAEKVARPSAAPTCREALKPAKAMSWVASAAASPLIQSGATMQVR
jgi:hypothetical protein